MKPEFNIQITPSSYKGWDIEFDEYADEFNRQFFVARKGSQVVSASKIGGIIHAIEGAEKLTAKFNPPIKVLYLDYSKWVRVEIHSICNETFYYTTEEGKQGSEFVTNLKSDHRKFVLDTPENVALINEQVKLNKKAGLLKRKAEETGGKIRKLTEADLMIAATGEKK